MAPTRTAKNPYRNAVSRLADVDPATHSADEFVERLGAVLDEVPALSGRRWELVHAMESVLGAEASVASVAGDPARLISDLHAERLLQAQAHREVLDEKMLTAEAVADALGSRSVNPRQYANTRRRKGELVGLPVKNRRLYPAFQFDAEKQRVRPSVAEVNRLLGAADDPWGAASWWFSADAWLGGERPADVVARDGGDARVLAAAQALVAPVG